MASRRALLSATRLLPTAATRHATPRLVTTARHSIQHQAPLGIANAVPRARFYSQKDDDNVVPGSKIWEFEDITTYLKNPDKNIVFIDVREPPELQQTGKIPGALNIPITSAVQSYHISPEDFEEMHGFERPSKDKTLVFYCKAGIRAKSAAGLAKHAGWNSVGEYTGSWLDWEAKHGPKQKV